MDEPILVESVADYLHVLCLQPKITSNEAQWIARAEAMLRRYQQRLIQEQTNDGRR